MDTTAVPVVNVGASGTSPWEVLAATKSNTDGFGFGSGGGLIGLLLILFLVGGMGGNGLWGNRNSASDAVLGNTTISTATGITGIQSTLNCQDKAIDLLFNQLGNLSTQNTAEALSITNNINRMVDINNAQSAMMQQGFANVGYQTQLGFCNLGHELQECCCANQQAIANLNNNITQQFAQLNYNNAMQNCELKQAVAAEGSATRQLIMQQYTEEVERNLAEAKTQLFFLQNCKTCNTCAVV